MKITKYFTLLISAVLFVACTANKDLVSLEEYDDLYYTGSDPQPVGVPEQELVAAYSGTGNEAEMSYYQNQPYGGVDGEAPAPKAAQENNEPKETGAATTTYTENDYYDADYAADYNNYHTGGLGVEEETTNITPRVSMSLGYNSFNGNSMWGMGMSYGMPGYGTSMYNNPYMGSTLGYSGYCPPPGSMYYDPWCNSYMPPYMGPAWSWNMSFGFGWGYANPWMYPYNPYCPYSVYSPYGYWNPYAPIYVNPPYYSDSGFNSPTNSQRDNSSGRSQRGGLLTPNSIGPDTQYGRRQITDTQSASNGVQGVSVRQLSTNPATPEGVKTKDKVSTNPNTRSLSPATRTVNPIGAGNQNSIQRKTRNSDIVSPYARQQNRNNPSGSGTINRGAQPSTQPNRSSAPQRNYSEPVRVPQSSSPSYSPRSSGSSGGNSGGGSVTPSRSRR